MQDLISFTDQTAQTIPTISQINSNFSNIEEKINKPLYKDVIDFINYRRNRVINNELNCIPFNLPGFEEYLPGVEHAQYVIITANQKVGKTQICDFLYLYTVIEYVMSINDPSIVDVDIHYFSLEVNKQKKLMQLMCYLLFNLTGQKIRISLKGLGSVFKDRIIDQEIIDILESEPFQKILDFYDKHVHIVDNVRNPFGIFNTIKNAALKHGHFEKKIIDWEDPKTKQISKKEVNGRFIKNNPNHYLIGIIDHYALMQPEKGQTSTRDAIVKFSSEYALELKNDYLATIVAIQQQAQSQESVENKKYEKLLPSVDGLGDAKITGRDVDLMIGLFSPYRHEYSTYAGYDINYWKNNFRILNIPANREGSGDAQIPLMFDGATNFFCVLPRPDSKDMYIYQNMLNRIRNPEYVENKNKQNSTSLFYHNEINTKKGFLVKTFKTIKILKNLLWPKF